ncbi:hypothetical protein THAOC_02817 [Thalassiosira oceanica]|uniref:Uncharacterized protein n=1 Tax=Thalassiosira oceanica TaxID=159749 RepID=K0TDD1_THAOC|nr:hypothetical protein THAOC_02817 [Thalassiosira oceanica]|eukprot:EJK75460.1 hypothetical protein THAOC_02817 [Thalassiosira oceanica]
MKPFCDRCGQRCNAVGARRRQVFNSAASSHAVKACRCNALVGYPGYTQAFWDTSGENPGVRRLKGDRFWNGTEAVEDSRVYTGPVRLRLCLTCLVDFPDITIIIIILSSTLSTINSTLRFLRERESDDGNRSGSEREDEDPSHIPHEMWKNLEMDEDAIFPREQLIKASETCDRDADARYVKLEASNGNGRSSFQVMIITIGYLPMRKILNMLFLAAWHTSNQAGISAMAGTLPGL